MTNTLKLKKGLGRGLSSLIGDDNTLTKSNKIAYMDFQIIKNKTYLDTARSGGIYTELITWRQSHEKKFYEMGNYNQTMTLVG